MVASPCIDWTRPPFMPCKSCRPFFCVTPEGSDPPGICWLNIPAPSYVYIHPVAPNRALVVESRDHQAMPERQLGLRYHTATSAKVRWSCLARHGNPSRRMKKGGELCPRDARASAQHTAQLSEALGYAIGYAMPERQHNLSESEAVTARCPSVSAVSAVS